MEARPVPVRVEIPVFGTSSACAGALASYVLRRISFRAGTHAPGIQDAIFHELHVEGDGGSLDEVQRWFVRRAPGLSELGYRLHLKAVRIPTGELIAWIRAGHGYRGAVLATSHALLHPGPSRDLEHSIGLSLEHRRADDDGELVMTDAAACCPVEPRGCVSSNLEPAHRDRAHAALAFHWRGWT